MQHKSPSGKSRLDKIRDFLKTWDAKAVCDSAAVVVESPAIASDVALETAAVEQKENKASALLDQKIALKKRKMMEREERRKKVADALNPSDMDLETTTVDEPRPNVRFSTLPGSNGAGPLRTGSNGAGPLGADAPLLSSSSSSSLGLGGQAAEAPLASSSSSSFVDMDVSS